MGVLVHPKDHQIQYNVRPTLENLGHQLSGEEFVTFSNKQENESLHYIIEKQNRDVKAAMKRFYELDRVPQEDTLSLSRQGISSKATSDYAHLSFEQILDLLLLSRENVYQDVIPLQKCASPVPFNNEAETFHSMFYVVKSEGMGVECRSPKACEGFQGIPVRYQGFTKCIVWFSEKQPKYGIVARRMQHQKRMKQKGQKTDLNMANKASHFFQVFEGFSYVLIERPDTTTEMSKSVVADYIVKDASKFVQVWPLGSESNNDKMNEHRPQRQRRHTTYENMINLGNHGQYAEQAQAPPQQQHTEMKRTKCLLRRRSKSLSALDPRAVKKEREELMIPENDTEPLENDENFVDLMCEYFEIESKSSMDSEYMYQSGYSSGYVPGEEVRAVHRHSSSADFEFQPERLDDFEQFFDEWRL
jgi:hypothetical protein